MKTAILTAALFFLTIVSFGQERENHFAMWGDTEIGGYVGLSGRATEIGDETHSVFDAKAVLVLNGSWGLGVTGSAFNYDKSLSALVDDGTYRLEASYGGFFIEKIFSFNKNFKLALSIGTGAGMAQYRYEKDYRKEKRWTEEYIDVVQFAFFEPGIEIEHRIAGNFWIGATGSFRNTSPLELLGTDDQLLQSWNAGISVKYGIF